MLPDGCTLPQTAKGRVLAALSVSVGGRRACDGLFRPLGLAGQLSGVVSVFQVRKTVF